MKRREVINGLASLGAMFILPDFAMMGIQTKSRPNFSGLGQGFTIKKPIALTIEIKAVFREDDN